jgi:hypothetical protein
MEAAARIARWILCGVVGSAAPLIINYLISIPKEWSYNPARVVNHGELCIVVAAMCAVSVGELLGTSSKKVITTIIAGSVTVLLLVLSTALYVYIPAGRDLPEGYIALVSYILFACSFAASVCCIGLSVAK